MTFTSPHIVIFPAWLLVKLMLLIRVGACLLKLLLVPSMMASRTITKMAITIHRTRSVLTRTGLRAVAIIMFETVVIVVHVHKATTLLLLERRKAWCLTDLGLSRRRRCCSLFFLQLLTLLLILLISTASLVGVKGNILEELRAERLTSWYF